MGRERSKERVAAWGERRDMKEANRVTGENRSERRNSKTINKLTYDIHQNVSIKKLKISHKG
jgi:hypothetical protein